MEKEVNRAAEWGGFVSVLQRGLSGLAGGLPEVQGRGGGGGIWHFPLSRNPLL